MSKFVEFEKAPWKNPAPGKSKDRGKILIDLESVVAIDELPDGSSGPECRMLLLEGGSRAVLGTLEEIKRVLFFLKMAVTVHEKK